MRASLHDHDQEHRLTGDVTVLGRAADACDLVLDDELVSRRHCVILQVPGPAWLVIDLNSSNGTQVLGAPVDHRVLSDGDRLQVGGVQLTFRIHLDGSPKVETLTMPNEGDEFRRAMGEVAARTDPDPEPAGGFQDDDLAFLEALHATSYALLELPPEQVAERAVRWIPDLLQATSCTVYAGIRGPLPEPVGAQPNFVPMTSCHVQSNLVRQAFRYGELAWSANLFGDGRFVGLHAVAMEGSSPGPAMAAPLRLGDGVEGYLYVARRLIAPAFTEEERLACAELARLLGPLLPPDARATT